MLTFTSSRCRLYRWKEGPWEKAQAVFERREFQNGFFVHFNLQFCNFLVINSHRNSHIYTICILSFSTIGPAMMWQSNMFQMVLIQVRHWKDELKNLLQNLQESILTIVKISLGLFLRIFKIDKVIIMHIEFFDSELRNFVTDKNI